MASKVTALIAEPAFTGALLYILTRGPPHVRERLLGPFRGNVLAGEKGAVRLEFFIKALKYLTGYGILKKINGALNALAWNNWSLGRSGSAFKFGPNKEELVIITGGSSGFGYEMVMGFSKIARVVALDISDFPPELARCECYDCGMTSIGLIVISQYRLSTSTSSMSPILPPWKRYARRSSRRMARRLFWSTTQALASARQFSRYVRHIPLS